jgi:hypothetical protein
MFQIHFHGQDLESLHSHIDPKFLPKRYGGMRPEYSYTDWIEGIVDNKAIIAGKYFRFHSDILNLKPQSVVVALFGHVWKDSFLQFYKCNA